MCLSHAFVFLLRYLIKQWKENLPAVKIPDDKHFFFKKNQSCVSFAPMSFVNNTDED